MIKKVTHTHVGLIWYHSEPSPIPQTISLPWTFFSCFLQQEGSINKVLFYEIGSEDLGQLGSLNNQFQIIYV